MARNVIGCVCVIPFGKDVFTDTTSGIFSFLFLNISLEASEMPHSAVPKLAAHWNHLGIFKNSWCLVGYYLLILYRYCTDILDYKMHSPPNVGMSYSRNVACLARRVGRGEVAVKQVFPPIFLLENLGASYGLVRLIVRNMLIYYIVWAAA